MSRSKTFYIVVCLLCVNLLFSSFLFVNLQAESERLSELEEKNDMLEDQLILHNEAVLGGDAGSVDEVAYEGVFPVYDHTKDEGALVDYSYIPLPSDRIVVDTTISDIRPDFQSSLRNSQAAISTTDYEPVSNGFFLRVHTPETWDFLGGESASLTIAAQIAATDPDYELNDSVVLTGDVTEDGFVDPVRFVTAKAEAAAAADKEVIVAPDIGGPVRTDANIEVVRVRTIDEALEYALDPVGSE